MEPYNEIAEMDGYIAELKGLLAGRELSPEARARALATLIDANAARQVATTAITLQDDVMPMLSSAVSTFSESAGTLATALRRLPDR